MDFCRTQPLICMCMCMCKYVRSGNKKVFKVYNCNEFIKAAIEVTRFNYLTLKSFSIARTFVFRVTCLCSKYLGEHAHLSFKIYNPLFQLIPPFNYYRCNIIFYTHSKHKYYHNQYTPILMHAHTKL